jgi:hypothetical protein
MSVDEKLRELDERVRKLEEREPRAMTPATTTPPGMAGSLAEYMIFPERDIDEIAFNEQRVFAAFRKEDDGWFYSSRALFMSARRTHAGGRDVLSKYVGMEEIRERLAGAVGVPVEKIVVSLPKNSLGIKYYNGAPVWYWLDGKYPDKFNLFETVDPYGFRSSARGDEVGGVVLAFRVKGDEHGRA